MSYIVKLADLPDKLDSLDLILDKIVEGDCLDLMRRMPDKCVEAVITDPPYIWNETTGGLVTNRTTGQWGYGGMLRAADVTAGIAQVEFEKWIPLVARVLHDPSHSYIFTNDKNLHLVVNTCLSNKLRLHNILVWKKDNCTPNHWYMKNCEFVVFSRKGKAFPINDISRSHFIEFPNIDHANKQHPTQKPIEVISEFISNSTQRENLVFDPFLGSGTTAVAAKKLGRHFIGCEISPEYCKIAERRLQELDAQPSLFEPQQKAEQGKLCPAES